MPVLWKVDIQINQSFSDPDIIQCVVCEIVVKKISISGDDVVHSAYDVVDIAGVLGLIVYHFKCSPCNTMLVSNEWFAIFQCLSVVSEHECICPLNRQWRGTADRCIYSGHCGKEGNEILHRKNGEVSKDCERPRERNER